MFTTARDATSVQYHLDALKRRFGDAPINPRIASAAARGARRGRRMRWDIASIAVGAFFAVAFVTGGSMALQSVDSVQQMLTDAGR